MKKDDIARLLNRYVSARKEHKESYFDADEIDELLNSFEESEDFSLYDEVLAFGLKLHPDNTDLQIRQCRQYMMNENYEEALSLIKHIGETGNQDIDMLELQCYCMLEKYNKVIELTEKLISDEHAYISSLFEYVTPFLNDMELYKEAIDYAERGLKLYPDNLILKEEYCYALESEGDIIHAIKICNELIDKNPYSFDYWFSMGRLYSLAAEYDKAIEAFDFALTCDEPDPELMILKAYCLYMNESYEKAIEVYQELSSGEEIPDRIKPLMAECYIKMDQYEKAYLLLHDLATGENPSEEASVYIHYMRCCVKTNRDQEAFKTLLTAASLFPDNIRILSLLANAYMESGEEDKALLITDRLFNALDDIEKLENEDDGEGLYYSGHYLFVKGKIEKAISCYEKAYQINPDLPYIHIYMAMAYLSKGDMERFSKHYKQTSPGEMLRYMRKTEINMNNEEFIQMIISKPILSHELAHEYINNKDNSN
ncbi:tetratricopeptide repeat protein [Parabacteroides sp. 52]|uniref:tetratricopeptide repeat protein n=1 Tax=unclassified Parabacteroides TaxID=2649774 RepID=UPI0013D313D9|nr:MULTISPECIES: tetratricopeptide repeat protein [unclassified Parabacteroides]MDH6534424.1 tetratricopeptide (TPR) repeat protein [Parabacteroides sp. PM5-20]NDV55127.1 tetratricopeptide repeat protein [Parabacteroides sp. 52]